MLSPRSLALAAAASLAAAFTPSAAPAQWTNGQAAIRVVGQTAFNRSGVGTTDATLNNPAGVCLDTVHGKMYVADRANNRVLRFAYPIAADGPAAEAVFGQPSFTSNNANNGGLGPATMAGPYGVAVDPAGTLYVAERDNNRVLVFPSAHLAAATGAAATRVLGQPDFATRKPSPTAIGLRAPYNLAWEAPDRLWIADTGDFRVLRYDNVSTRKPGAPADGVLGQPDLATSRSTTTAAGLFFPHGLAVHRGTLFIADQVPNRILRHAAAATKPDGAAADGILGQADFTSKSAGTGAANLSGPLGLAIDPSGRLYVADHKNSRIAIFDDALAKSDGAPAEHVLGQGGFGSAVFGNRADQLNTPSGVAIDAADNRLIVCDTGNHRILVFQASTPLSLSRPTRP